MRRLWLAAAVLLGACGEDDPGVVEWRMFCAHQDGEIEFLYEIVDYTDGSTAVQCGLQDGLSTYTFNVTYPAGSVGADDGLCFFVYDLDEPTAGGWTYELDGNGIPIAQYTDTGSPSDGYVVDFTDVDCF